MKNTPPKIHLAAWEVYSSQEDFKIKFKNHVSLLSTYRNLRKSDLSTISNVPVSYNTESWTNLRQQ